MPFITFITRTIPYRADMLIKNQLSLKAQTDSDYEQIVIVDKRPMGVAWANGAMAYRDWSDVKGDYVMVLDDDDVLARPDIIARLKAGIDKYFYDNVLKPDLLIVQMDHGPRGILPADDLFQNIRVNWDAYPGRGRIGCSAVIPSRELFLKAVKSYRAAYDGDYDYIRACFENSKKPFWMQIIATRVQQIGALTEV